MPFTYIIFSFKYRKTYVGSSNDINRRLYEHNNSGKTAYTKRYRPWVVVYQEEYDNLTEARNREKYLKSSAGRKFIKKNKLIPNIPG